MSKGYMGGLYLTKSCTCAEKDKDNWIVVEVSKSANPSYIVRCEKCRNQWRTKAKYVGGLKRAGYLR